MIKIPTGINIGKHRFLLSLCLFLSANLETQAQQQTIPPPAGSGAFGTSVVVLSNGNYVVTDPYFDDGALVDVGAAYLYNGSSHALISTLKGNTTGAQVSSGGVTALPNGNFVVRSPGWGDGVSAKLGAVTFVNGTSGLNAAVSNTNSLVGSTTNDSVGGTIFSITVLANGNYVVGSSRWDNGSIANAGAVTWGSGITGIAGAISASNSLVGSTANDQIGITPATALPNGNYIVSSSLWDNATVVNAGAVTLCNGNSGTSGPISNINSLVGNKVNDNIGSYSPTILTNGNYVLCNPNWDDGGITDVGAVTWCNGATGIVGTISNSNSLIGSSANDQVGLGGADALTNGNYVVKSYVWKNGTTSLAGAVTWGNGATGTTGIVSTSNSLVGSKTSDAVGTMGTALPNGNYVVRSHLWDSSSTVFNAGAVTWFDGNGGTTGVVSSSNSLVGSTPEDQVGSSILVLANGNYVIITPSWNYGTCAVTWFNGTTTGITGTVNSSNSLIGSGASVLALSNGNYVVLSPGWDNGILVNVGAVTWVNGTTGITGMVTSANSLVGTKSGDFVGSGGVKVFTNGNYVVASPAWDNGAIVNVGAVTYGNGAGGTVGPITSSNSLVGSSAGDSVGSNGLLALSNGNYVVASPNWKNGTITGAGAVTWIDGSGVTTGQVSNCNSFVGTTVNEKMGNVAPIAFTNGNYITGTSNWDNGTNLNVGARIIGNASSALTGTINSCNGVLGLTGTGASMTQVFNSIYNYAIVTNRTSNSVVAYYGATTTDPTLANHLDLSSTMICAASSVSFITNSGCRVIGSITPNGSSPVTGIINAKTWIEPSVPVFTGKSYVARHMEVTPVTNPSGATEKVTLYFTQQEFTDFNADPSSTLNLPTGPGDAAGIANLRIGQYIGTSNNGTGLPGTYPSGTTIDPADTDIIWNAVKNWWEVSFDMIGSGGLIVGTFTTVPLPLDLLEFRGKLRDDDAVLNWKTENEDHTVGFDVERSTDGKSYTTIGFVSSTNHQGINHYTFTDHNVSSLSTNGVYYRLKQKDTDSRHKYSQVVRLSLSDKNMITLYPNPANMKATLSISLTKEDQLQLRILDNIGRIVQQQLVPLSSGITTIPLDMSKLASGIYYLELKGNTLNERKQFVKQ